ncbi:MAG: DNA polymerase/3'-5' exonuclease PolX [Haloarculaceae archaeon]
MTRNAEVAARLQELADLLEAKDVDYKPRAYRRAAENVRDYPVAIETLAADGPDAVAEIEGVGDAISEKVVEYVETGQIEELERLREAYPVDMVALTGVEGLGPKRVGRLYDALGIRDLDDLEAAARAGDVATVEGFGEKTQQNFLEGIPFAREAHERDLLGDARPVGERVRETLADVDGADRVAIAGSLRRWRATIGDVDVLVASESPEAVVDAFVDWDRATDVVEAGESKAAIRVAGLRVDLRVVAPGEFGSALQYFTGSKAHNVRLRNRAIDRDLKMNEYGVFDVAGVADPDAGQRVGDRVAGETEASMYEALDLSWMPPELREDRGEVQAAADGALPTLLTEDDVRGDLHVHTDRSDGNATLAEMVEGATAFGHDYLAITDHATGPGMVGGVGVDDDALLDQARAVRELDAESDLTLFAGVEANVDASGGVSVADDVLAELDLVVASPHSALDGDGTDRLVAAVEHPHVDVLGHPTGRLLNQREGLSVDVETLAAAAAEHDTALEVNSNPSRLDLSGSAVKTAVEAGATVAVDTDAHRPASFDLLTYGVHTARRGWAGPDDVLNAWSTDDLRAWLAD